jgi:hypothetical protein
MDSGKWKHDKSQEDLPTRTRVSDAALYKAFTDSGRRGFQDAQSIEYKAQTSTQGTSSVNVRHRSGSVTEFHMHGDELGTTRHTSVTTHQVLELTRGDMGAATRNTIVKAHEFGKQGTLK